MKKNELIKFLLTLAVAAPLLGGCASPNVNPSRARANTGYVDFHADPPGDLCWDVSRFDDRSQTFKEVFSDLTPPAGGVLRLAFAPGNYRFKVTFLNRVTKGPTEVAVEVQDGKITPVYVMLAETGTVSVQQKELNMGPSIKGNARIPVRYSSNETVMYELSSRVELPVSYLPKGQMPGAR